MDWVKPTRPIFVGPVEAQAERTPTSTPPPATNRPGPLAIAAFVVAVVVPGGSALLAMGGMPRRSEFDELRRDVVEVQRKLDRLETKLDLLLPAVAR